MYMQPSSAVDRLNTLSTMLGKTADGLTAHIEPYGTAAQIWSLSNIHRFTGSHVESLAMKVSTLAVKDFVSFDRHLRQTLA